ncbi:hypothetical protein E5673_01135 [Sphingomonas sp. PAMC26645]|uniref:hypothetical protein n=1 Tax=Sphingomonas sp. PAMC26645 TaxID=2565555 RepID=UPI00109DC4F9|nr:hypothetical protein [Sphingomonas sp. PAMC26645]QCB41000.1 hypothetical protein E5673_01135 [Sphingomonas sp. PAMC26645]
MKRLMMAVALGLAMPVAARDLSVPTDKGWKHAETGLILMPQLAEMSRTALTDATQTEHDVAAQYETPDKNAFATIYLFHPAIADVSFWFDRSQTALEARDLFKNASPATADPIAFAVGGARAASSLRQVYATPAGQYRSTALSVVPVGDWIVSVRMSAKTLTAEQLDARLQQVIAAIRWPQAVGAEAPAAAPLKGCATPLTFGKAKLAKPDGADLLMSLMGSSLAAKKNAEAKSEPLVRTTWCRDGDTRTEYGMYRSDGASSGYVLALYDAGRVVSVYPSIMGQINKTGLYSVSLEDVEGTVSAFQSFTALPSPNQVWSLINHGQRTGTKNGNQLTMSSKAFSS